MDPDKRPGRFRLRGERGSMLIEVMVGAIVLAIAATAILNGIDGAQSAGAKNKAKSIQASLAQQDIERMRGLPVGVLSGLNQTRTVNVGGVDYTVVSTTAWISDKAGAVNCSTSGAAADYLKLTSSVTSPGTGTAAVTETGLLTPSVGQSSTTTGSATVQLTGRSNTAISGATVALSGASSQSATTNSSGCAVFGSIPVGSYTITINGYVTIDSTAATDSMEVFAGRGTFVPLQVDRPATVRASFVRPTGQTNGAGTATWNELTVVNANLVGGSKVFTTGTKTQTLDGAGLFPYLDGVDVYAGDCAANDPSSYTGQSNYFQVGRGFTSLTPNTTSVVTTQMPALRVPATYAGGGSWQLRVTLKPVTSDGCGTATTATYGQDTLASGTHNADFIVPFGTYRICADNGSRFKEIASYALTAAPPTANRTTPSITIPTTGIGTSGTCPQ
jgi:type II secretory pathway pseudopilin PulG